MRKLSIAILFFVFFTSKVAPQQAPIRCPGKLNIEQLEMLVHDVPEARVNAFINTCGVSFSLNKEIEDKLRSAGATEGIVKLLYSLFPNKTMPAPKTEQLSREAEYWKSIRDSKDPQSFRKCLEQFPAGVLRKNCEQQLHEIEAENARQAQDKDAFSRESEFWRSIRDSNRIEDFHNYLRQFPDGIYRSLAEDRAAEIGKEIGRELQEKEKQAKQKKREGEFWELIRESEDPQSFSDYLKLFPEGANRKLCLQRLLELSKNDPTLILDRNLRDALVLYLTFDKTEGGKVTDFSGKGNHGRNIGAVWTPNGKSGGAYEFSGDGNRILVRNNASFAFRQITMAAWIKTSIKNEKWRRIFDKSLINQNNFPGFNLGISGDWRGDPKWRGNADFDIFVASNHWLRPDDNITDGQWHFITATYDGVVQCLYIDAQPKARVNWEGSIPETNYDLIIGCVNPDSAAGGNSFLGIIDEPMIFNRALTPQEIKLLYELRK
jgi:hypothetical protein